MQLVLLVELSVLLLGVLLHLCQLLGLLVELLLDWLILAYLLVLIHQLGKATAAGETGVQELSWRGNPVTTQPRCSPRATNGVALR